jgi:aminoglycoside phosphotransferase (APT) family kinase protein
MPAAELEITADLVSRLLAAQHPDLAGLTVEPLANGWDNTLFLLGEELVARLPRRTLGASILLNEQRWLPSLAPRLPLPVPVPVRTGGPGEGTRGRGASWHFYRGRPPRTGPRSTRGGRRRTSAASSAGAGP